MATEKSNITRLPTKPLTDAQRAKRYRERKKAAARAIVLPASAAAALVTSLPAHRLTLPSPLTIAAFGLGAVGITMNGWFARSLGSSDVAGWLFLAIGVAADAVALAIPTASAAAWATRQRGAALAGWLVFVLTFAFAVTAGIGFASVNVTDVTMSRAGRVTPAVTAAQAALNDAQAARNRECAGGVGKFCREREAAVTKEQQALDVAMQMVAANADPQTAAAAKIVAWVSLGTIRPSGDDFAMVRLILLALLPQLGGILLMVGRAGRKTAA